MCTLRRLLASLELHGCHWIQRAVTLRRFATLNDMTGIKGNKEAPNKCIVLGEIKMAQSLIQQTNVDAKPPQDRYYMVYMILLLQGIGILMPWNMFITARSYFVDYKMSKDYTGEETNYATYFLSYVGFASHIPILIFNWINVFINIGGSVTPRIVSTISIEITIFVITIILAWTDSRSWSSAFFWCTMAGIIIMNMANGIYENTVFGLAAKLPFKYPGAVILGCNTSGALVSIIELLTIAVAPGIKTAAIYYFITALVVLLMCLVSYFVLPLIKFYSYYESLKKPSGITANENEGTKTKIPYWKIFKKASFQLFNVFFVFFVTLSIFPALQADIKKSDSEFIVPEKYYENILCFLTFNTTAVLGSLVSNWINWPSPKTLLIPVVLRAFFIPFFFFCNFQPTNKARKVPVLIPNDWVYWIGSMLLGFSSGYFSCKALAYTTGSVDSTDAAVTGMFGGAIIVTGIFFGVMLSMAFPFLAET